MSVTLAKITCRQCHLIVVEATVQKVSHRISTIKSKSRKGDRTCALYAHFATCGPENLEYEVVGVCQPAEKDAYVAMLKKQHNATSLDRRSLRAHNVGERKDQSHATRTVMYLQMNCRKCGDCFLDVTERPVYTRINNIKSKACRTRICRNATNEHFRLCGVENMQYTVLSTSPVEEKSMRVAAYEKYFNDLRVWKVYQASIMASRALPQQQQIVGNA